MKLTSSSCQKVLAALSVLLMSSAALASGSHAGGHGTEETAIGKPGMKTKVNRTITIEMSDNMRFTPAEVPVKQGETIQFVVKNKGQINHELNLGTEQELLEHLEVMKKFPNMEHDEPGKVSLAPGKQGEIIWQFAKAGIVNFGCLIPGHYEAGMKGAVSVGKRL